MMQSIKDDETVFMVRARPRRPRALVLVPTRELALQVYKVAKKLSHHAKFSAEVIHGGVPDPPQCRRLERPVDLLVATPGRALKLMERGALFLGDVRYVVLDEVDTMFDAGFGDDLDAVLKITTRDLSADLSAADTRTSNFVQHLAVGATHPESALALYDRWLRGTRRYFIDGSHSLPETLQQQFLVCNGPTAKVAALRDLLGVADVNGRPSIGRVVLFCNSQQSARFVDHELTEIGYSAANYHGAIPANERSANFSRFVDGAAHVLVTTDLAARGLDELQVGHVIQFDFAKSAADYLHRCGRTARAGRRGTVTSLVTKSDRELVRAIQKAHKDGSDLVTAGVAAKAAAKAAFSASERGKERESAERGSAASRRGRRATRTPGAFGRPSGAKAGSAKGGTKGGAKSSSKGGAKVGRTTLRKRNERGRGSSRGAARRSSR
jgi:superfamily II DNA/RNA helicase